VVSRALDDDPFFSFRHLWALTYDQMNDAVKLVMAMAGVTEFLLKRFKTHSVRIGGASALANKNVPDYMIQRMGRWKSLAFLDYLRMSVEAFATSMDILTDIASLTISDILKMCPGVSFTNQLA
jgi:hypothetical protein